MSTHTRTTDIGDVVDRLQQADDTVVGCVVDRVRRPTLIQIGFSDGTTLSIEVNDDHGGEPFLTCEMLTPKGAS